MEPLKINELFKEIPLAEIRGNQEIEVKGLTANSKQAAPGFLFIVKRGQKSDGSKFIPEAIQKGAAALLSDTYNPHFKEITQVVHPQPRSIELFLAQRFYDNPTRKLEMIGVTGTNGKTTTTYLIKYLLEQKGILCGLVGTIAWVTGKKAVLPTLTTPDSLTLMHLFGEMVHEGVRTVVMEVTSHALHQKRVEGIDFQIAVFTNLTQDHLDYHQTMEAYGAAKALLFESLTPSAWALINADDPAASLMTAKSQARLFTYGMSFSADLYAADLRMTLQGMEFEVHYQKEKVLFQTRLVGRFNVYNILAATAVALIRGVTLSEVSQKIASFEGIPGRLERVVNGKNLQIFVDYSHTPDSLENALKTLQEFKQGRLITVFGCGGDRDQTKRPIMGSIAERLSDIAILTSDNPRSEDPGEIARQVLKGCKEAVILELDRRKAIELATQLATPQDTILIAGKGHETTQTFAGQTVHFDDREVARQCCRA